MAGVVDTDLLLYAANEDAAEHGAARDFLEVALQSADQWYLTEGIVYEFMRVSTHPRVFAQPLEWRDGFRFLSPLLSSRAFALLSASDRQWPLLEAELNGLRHPAGNLFFDIRTVVLMKEHGVREIYTTDTDFLQFAGITVIDPLRGS